ncbi:MAG TPA: cell division protein FtsA [Anaerolineae bacterium]|nr:cell division protein FtsA [Anaerolineae bacterium]
MPDTICAIDVGTTKVCAIIAEVVNDTTLEIVGYGRAASDGMTKGVVTNVAAATAAIGQAVEEAEQAADRSIGRAYVGIAGSHIQAQLSKGAVPIGRNRIVSAEDVARVKEAARAVALPHNREIIHVVPRSFAVDEQEDLLEPIGMHGFRLAVDAQVISGATGAVRNLVRCVQTHGIEIEELVLEPLASGEAVLTEAERDMGVVVVDIGGGTTDLAMFMKGSLWHTVVIDVGGQHLTHDLAVGLGAPFEAAEQLKLRFGSAMASRVPPDQEVTVEVFGENGPHTVPRQLVAEILEARAEEMVDLMLREIKRSGYDGLVPAGLVLTGGTAQLPGLRELARQMTQLPVRIGVPSSLANMPPDLRTAENATGVGLLLWALHNQWVSGDLSERRQRSPFMERVMRWLKNLLPG